MKKTTSANVSRLADGIRGIYMTRRYRTRRGLKAAAALALAAVLVVAVILSIPQPEQEPWDGELLVICYDANIYDKMFSRMGKDLWEAFSITQEEFEEKAHVTVAGKGEYRAVLKERGLSELVDPGSIKVITYHYVLLDSSGNLLYSGISESMVVDILESNGFSAGG